MGERCPYKANVGGSNPSAGTKTLNYNKNCSLRFWYLKRGKRDKNDICPDNPEMFRKGLSRVRSGIRKQYRGWKLAGS